MKSTPLISVIMNCYNGEAFLKNAIDSVYAQTYKNWEIIFWDNASTDTSADIALSYDERLKYFKDVETKQQLMPKLIELIDDDQTCQTLSKELIKMAKPNATKDIVDQVESLILIPVNKHLNKDN